METRFQVDKKWRTMQEYVFRNVCKVFGNDSLNKQQEDFIKYVVQEKEDVFMKLPTEFGKSMIYQALSLVNMKRISST